MAIKPELLLRCLNDDLSANGCTDSVTLFPDASVKDAFAVSIRSSLLKKFTSKISPDADEKALLKFLHSNNRCKNWTLRIEDTKTEILYNTLRQVLYEFWYKSADTPLVDHPFDVLEKARLGPGSNRGAYGNSLYAKLFSSPLTYSDHYLYFWYKRYIRCFPEFSNAENIRQENFGSAVVLPSTKLSFVPKNDEISRVICVEPTLNTYFQLGFAHILESRLNGKFGISLKDQQFKNRDLARLGSITDGLSTIDLSSASDSISLSMLKAVLPHDFFMWLTRLRCTGVDIKGRGTEELHMVSTMGNGFTFPLQTILFSCVVVACARFRGLPLTQDSSDRLWGVFGDDIICPELITQDVISLLNTLGFEVNDEKTFVKGPFRESCGADFFNGVNVRGVYLKKIDTEAALYNAVNQLIRFSTRSEIYLWRTLTVLIEEIRKPLWVPPYEDTSCGIHVPESMVRNFKRNRDTQSISYELLVPVLPRYRIADSYVSCPRGAKQLIYNPSGLLMSFLHREVNSCSIGFRTEAYRYRRKRRYSSFWGSSVVIDRDRPDYGLDWQRWDSVASSYLERGS